MRCPECGSGTRILDKRQAKLIERDWRRHECKGCSHRFSTVEIMKADWAEMLTSLDLKDAEIAKLKKTIATKTKEAVELKEKSVSHANIVKGLSKKLWWLEQRLEKAGLDPT